MTEPPVPHNVEAEESVLGGLLLSPDMVDFVNLDAEDFFIHRHRFIWNAIQAVHAEGLALDFVTVNAELKRRHQLDEVGGAGALYDLMNRTPDAENVESYAEVVRQTAVNRRHIELAQSILKQSMNGGVDVASAIEALTLDSTGEREGRHISLALEDIDTTLQ